MIGSIAPTFVLASIMFQVESVPKELKRSVCGTGHSDVWCSRVWWLARDGSGLHPGTQLRRSARPLLPFQFVLQLHDVLHDRESGARQAMQTMGLRTSMYWASWIGFQVSALGWVT